MRMIKSQATAATLLIRVVFRLELGVSGAEQAQGRWRIEGSLRQGRIYLTGQNGNQRILNYQVHVKGGEACWGEYFFNNRLYSVKYIYR